VSCELLLEFCDPLHISGTSEARKFKFGTLKQNASNDEDQ